jgi:NADH-quinone oxidoreductase subunit H
MQNRLVRRGISDCRLLKLIGKKTLIPVDANKTMFTVMPLVSLAAVAAGFLMCGFWSKRGFFLRGRPDYCPVLPDCTSPRDFPRRLVLQRRICDHRRDANPDPDVCVRGSVIYFPIGPTLITEHGRFRNDVLLYGASLYALITFRRRRGFDFVPVQLERAPFDTPEAETEIVSGALVEYGGRLLAFFKMTHTCELVLVVSLFSAVFLPFMSETSFWTSCFT